MRLFGGKDKERIAELEKLLAAQSEAIALLQEDKIRVKEAERILALHRKEVKLEGVRLGIFLYDRAQTQAMLRQHVHPSITLEGSEDCKIVIYSTERLDEAAMNGLRARINFRVEVG